MRILGGILACLFLAVAPVIMFSAEGWRKAGVIPVVGFGILFAIHALRGRKRDKPAESRSTGGRGI